MFYVCGSSKLKLEMPEAIVGGTAYSLLSLSARMTCRDVSEEPFLGRISVVGKRVFKTNQGFSSRSKPVSRDDSRPNIR